MKKNQTATTATTNTATTERKDFSTVLRKYETAYRQGKDSTDFADVLEEVATAIAYSVLKKCIDVSQNEQLIDVRRSIAKDRNTLQNIDYSSKHAFKTVYTADGDRERQTADTSYRDAYNKLTQQTLGDGLDLVNTAIVSLLDETEKTDTVEQLFISD